MVTKAFQECLIGEAARIASFMAQHERALVQLASNVVAGHADPAAPVAALLHFPLPRPE